MIEYNRGQSKHGEVRQMNRSARYRLLPEGFDTVTTDETELVIDDVIQGVEPRISMPSGWLGVGGSPLYSVCCWRRRMER